MAKEMTLDELSRNVSKTTTKNNSTPVVSAPPQRPTTANANGGGMKPISMAELNRDIEAAHPEQAQAKAQREDGITPEIVGDAFSSMDAVIEQKKKNADAMVEAVANAVEEEQMEKDAGADEEVRQSVQKNDFSNLDDIENEIDKDLADEDSEEQTAEEKHETERAVMSVPDAPKMEAPVEQPKQQKPVVKKPAPKKDNDSDLSEFDDLLNEIDNSDSEYDVTDDEEETPEELREKFKANMGSIVATKNPINFAEYKISQKPISASRILENAPVSNKKRADWPLYYSKRNVTFEECDGPELDALRKTIRNSNGVNGVIASLRFVYNHIVDANKPTFEAWTKMIRTEDIESLYFGQYLSCYSDSNLIARTHEIDSCKKTSLIDTDIYSMVKYDNDDVKSECDNIRTMDSTTPASTIQATPLQISDDYVLTFRPATLYSTFIQFSTLRPDITEKHSDILNTMAYVEGFYKIDRESKQLIPMAVKEYPNNINKTVLSKLKAYVQILKTLTTDQYNILVGKLANIIEDPKVTYVYPVATCTECGGEIPEQPIDSVLNLLFTRAQLAQVKSL
jgi:hypothetical protein